MRKMALAVTLALILATATGVAPRTAVAQQGAMALRGGTIHTLTDDSAIENGVLVIQDGRIAAVGGPDTPIPADAEVVDVSGLHLLPGYLDAVTRVGLTEIGQVAVTSDFRELGNNNPHLQAATAVHPASEIIPVTRSNGVTHVVAAPQGNGLAGQGSLIHLDGWTVEEMLIERSAYLVTQWPALQARGFRRFGPQRSYRESKEAYDEAIADLQKLLDDARRYQAAGVGDDPLRRDLKLEALVRVLEGELQLLVSVNEARGIRDAVQFAERNGVRIIIAGGVEADQVAELLVEHEIPVILGSVQAMPNGADAGYDEAYARPARLHAAGVKFAISTYNASSSRTLPYEAATAVGYGLPHKEAVRAITTYPAQILGVGDRLGTLEVGKLANVTITDGDPLEITTQVEHIVINGRLLDPRDNKHDLLYERYRSRPRRGTQ